MTIVILCIEDSKSLKVMKTASILMIDRLRMGTDGDGITTLVGFYECPLHCKYCINNHCHSTNSNSIMTSIDLYNRVKIDQLYFRATGGGLTFGGGEPLLNAKFIEEVLNFGAKDWHTTIETSLNVPIEKWKCLVEYVDEYIVDVKDMNPSIYKLYTGSNNEIVINDLKEFQQCGFSDRVLLRLPLIHEYNDEDDILRSRHKLVEMGFSRFNEFKYRIL